MALNAPPAPHAGLGAARVTLRLALVLRRFADGQSEFELQARTADEALRALVDAHPALARQVFDSRGGLRRVVQVLVNGHTLVLDAGNRAGACVLSEGDCIELVSSFGAD